MTDAAGAEVKKRRATPVLDVCVRVVCFAIAAFGMLQVAQSTTYHAQLRSFNYVHRGGVPFEYYAVHECVLDNEPDEKSYLLLALTANVVFWAGCLGVSIFLVHHNRNARCTLREFFLGWTLFCVGLSVCLSGGAEQIQYGGCIVVFCTLFCIVSVWYAQRMVEMYFDIKRGIYG